MLTVLAVCLFIETERLLALTIAMETKTNIIMSAAPPTAIIMISQVKGIPPDGIPNP